MTPKRYSSVYYSISISNCGNFWDDIEVNNFESIQIRNYGLIIVLCLVNCQTLVSLSLVLRFTWLNYLSLMYNSMFFPIHFSVSHFLRLNIFSHLSDSLFFQAHIFSDSHSFRLTFFQTHIFSVSHLSDSHFFQKRGWAAGRLGSTQPRSTQIDSNRLKLTQID